MAAGVELTGSVSGYGCEFVDPLPRFIQGECSICLLVLREPHLTSCCGHNFCRHCIEAIIKNKKPCPLCQQCEFTTLHNKGLERSLKELVVTCEKALSGCNWKGELGKMDGHLNETCPYVDLRCRYVGCDTSTKRQDMPQHEATCKFRPFNCEHCESHEATFDDVVNKHWPVCPKYPVSCSNKCESLVERQHLQHHIDDECPLTEVLCEFSYAGCHVKVPRRDFQAHVCSDILIHLSMVSKMNKKLLHDNHQLSAKVIEMQTIMCEQKATITALQTNVGEQKAKITALETNTGEQKATIIALQTNVGEQKATIIALQTNMGEQKATITMLRTNVDEQKAAITALQTNLGKQEARMDTAASLLGAHAFPVKMEINMPPAGGKPVANNALIQKCDFYSHLGGYKMQLQARMRDNQYQPNLYLTVHIMRGEYDARLQWPFNGTVVISVLGKQYVIDFCNASPNLKSRVLQGDLADVGFGPTKPVYQWNVFFAQPLCLQVTVDDVTVPNTA